METTTTTTTTTASSSTTPSSSAATTAAAAANPDTAKTTTPTTTTATDAPSKGEESDSDNSNSSSDSESNHEGDNKEDNKESLDSSSSSSATAEESKPPQYDPNRVYTPQQLEVLNILVHPLWIFDCVDRRMRWANQAGLDIWNAASLVELQERDFSDVSPASAKRMEEFMWHLGQGRHISEQWTMYPKGQAKTVHMNVSGCRLSPEDDHFSLVCEGIPLLNTDLLNENLRGVEMLRHLPMAVCQFDLQGKVMFQNPEACLVQNSTTAASAQEEKGDGEAQEESNDEPEGPQTENKETNEDVEEEPLRLHRDPSSASLSAAATTVTDDDDETAPKPIKQRLSKIMKSDANPNDTRTKKRKSTTQSTRGDLLHRFVDPAIGRQILLDIQKEACDKIDMEALLHTQNNQQRWCAIQVRKTHDPVTGQPVILYNAQDKSDAIQARKEKLAREQKSEFLAIMAHEIRTPLHQVTGFVDLLDQTTLNTEQRSFVQLLKASTQGLMTVINDTLDYSKLEAGKMKLERITYEPLMVTEGSLEAVRATAEEKHLWLKLQWSKDIPFRLLGDPNRLRQVLLNLLSNAVKFTSHGGITVGATLVPKNNDPASPSSATSSVVRFTVSDTGMGVSKEHRETIFQKYQQANLSVARNFGGTGLGLSICQLLVQNMGGSIGVEDNLHFDNNNNNTDKGACFWFELPVQEPVERISTEDEVAAAQKVEEETACLNILVVEDNKVNQKVVTHMLKRMGHKSTVADNGKIAIDMIDHQQLKYDLVLMDIQMPVMDGLEATRRLRKMGYHDLPIYGLTASVARSDYTELGFNDWLTKPIPMKELKTKLRRISLTSVPEKQ